MLICAAAFAGLSVSAADSHASDDLGAMAPGNVDLGDEALDPSPASANKVFKLRNPFPFPIEVKIYGSGSPGIVRVPGPPAAYVPVAFPNTSMRVRVRVIGGPWSKKFKLKWKAGPILLPSP